MVIEFSLSPEDGDGRTIPLHILGPEPEHEWDGKKWARARVIMRRDTVDTTDGPAVEAATFNVLVEFSPTDSIAEFRAKALVRAKRLLAELNMTADEI